jgi:hypothetical protein
MKAQIIVTVLATAFAAVGVATASPPQSVEPNPGSPQADHSHNCVAVFSSDFIHNGIVVSQEAQAGARSAIIQATQALNC